MVRLPSFRFRILALVLGVAIVPLALIGAVLLRGASQSGERLLSERLERAADDTQQALVRRWIPLRSMLLDASEWPEVQDAVDGTTDQPLHLKLLELDPRVREVEIRTLQEGTVFGSTGQPSPPMKADFPRRRGRFCA